MDELMDRKREGWMEGGGGGRDRYWWD